MRPLTVASLFAGVGGFDLAFQRAGAKVVAAVEIDAPARKVLARQFPDTALFPDVTKVSGDDLRRVGFVPERGVITGGFPCQDVSVAGRRAGLAGSRTGLFWEIVRLLADLHPAWVVLENVPGLLSSDDGRDMGAVLGALGELGYGFAYRVLDAKHFGVPQQRRRVFIVGHLGDPFGAAAQVLLESEGGERDSAAGSAAGAGVAEPASVGAGEVGGDMPYRRIAHGSYGLGVGTLQAQGGDCGGGSESLLVTHTHTTTLQGGGKRGYRIDAESAAGGHLIVTKVGGSVDR